ncbi:hypothetical protein L1077_16575 [Pseudoalteromonas luteoviolacea]|uniref:hypothetical protein n=1 Tax=Pseudoalteromonas luteoviolacea TaxID=43657 RepID=UPI001F2F71CF|nr:hypothetical protein [Pseudoalteromonas luteoviolacea]MCF6441053.1 hypothetical protein [Pseudoalteromonas luteoviolacea]
MTLVLKSLCESLLQICKLADNWHETDELITANGRFNEEIRLSLLNCLQTFTQNQVKLPNLQCDEDTADIEYLDEIDQYAPPANWNFSISKSRLLSAIPNVRESDMLFLDIDNFSEWSSDLSPLNMKGLEFDTHVHLYVYGLQAPFGGHKLTVSNIEEVIHDQTPNSLQMPNEKQIRSVLHVISDKKIFIDPSAFSLIWGDFSQPAAQPFLRLNYQLLLLTLAQDICVKDDKINIIIRGTRRIEVPLVNSGDKISQEDLTNLSEAVRWVYEERSETRHKLLTDRLSIEADEEQSFKLIVKLHISDAHRQAKDSYGFVVLERSDAYHKELRDVIKDVRAQADLFAAKVRDLISTLLRDALAVLFLIGISLVGRFKGESIGKLVSQYEIQLFFKVLAIYFLVSIILQTLGGSRDVKLSESESRSWQALSKEYVPEKTIKEYFVSPLEQRKKTYYMVTIICWGLYLTLALLSWNLQFVLNCFLSPTT